MKKFPLYFSNVLFDMKFWLGRVNDIGKLFTHGKLIFIDNIYLSHTRWMKYVQSGSHLSIV
jgi:hypothetical protein